jgi:two-component system response regulator HydG
MNTLTLHTLNSPWTVTGMTFVATDDSGNRHLNILVVDDTEIVRTTISRMLAGRGYNVSEASSGEEALALIATTTIDLLVSDLRLGEGMSGAELITKATVLQPGAKTILMSGSISVRRSQKPSYPVLAKPFREAELMELVSGLLHGN